MFPCVLAVELKALDILRICRFLDLTFPAAHLLSRPKSAFELEALALMRILPQGAEVVENSLQEQSSFLRSVAGLTRFRYFF